MIRSYGDKRTERFVEGESVTGFESFRRQAEKRLRILEAATNLADLRWLPSNRLESLRATGKGNLASGSTIIGAFASSGRLASMVRRTSKSSTIAREKEHGKDPDSSGRNSR